MGPRWAIHVIPTKELEFAFTAVCKSNNNDGLHECVDTLSDPIIAIMCPAQFGQRDSELLTFSRHFWAKRIRN